MSNYTKTTDFEAKDSLPSGDNDKIIKGAEFETEFDAISTAIATKADTAGPTFTGTATFATTNATTVQIGGVAITSTAAELNTLDGITSTTAELNTLDGFTGTVDDLNYAKDLRASGVTGDEFDILDGLTATAAELNILDGATLSTAELNLLDGVTATTAELNILDGVTSTGIELNILDGVTATTAELNLLDGITATTTELNYVDGVTSSIQSQIDTKSPIASPTFTGTVTIPTADINGGAVDGVVIGGTTAAAGSFTTVSATGNITVDGTVDGRDVATDGTKLDGIEASATADQTDAEIRAAVEAATDSNVFTDADHTKLDGIEALADVTDTTNVTAAGALMDSELTNLTAVKSLDQGVATTDTPTFAGLATSANVTFGDNDKAIFGAGSDLEIYHDGSRSYISDQGTGGLRLLTNEFSVMSPDESENLFFSVQDDSTYLYQNNSIKLQTTSTGIDVTGTAVTDGLTVAGATALTHSGTTLSVDRTGGATALIELQQASTIRGYLGADSTKSLIVFNGSAAEKFSVSDAGVDVTGNVDASLDLFVGGAVAGNAGTRTINVGTAGSVAGGVQIWSGTTQTSFLQFGDDSTTSANHYRGYLSYNHSTDSMQVGTAGSERMRIDSSGRVGIGTSSPSVKLDVNGEVFVSPNTAGKNTFQLTTNASNDARLKMLSDTTTKVDIQANGTSYFNGGNVGIGTSSPSANLEITQSGNNVGLLVAGGGYNYTAKFESSDAEANIIIEDSNSTNDGNMIGVATNDMYFITNASERMRISSAGNVGIGTSSPASKLDINGDGTTLRLDGTANTSRTFLLRNVGGSAEGVIQTDGNMHLLQEDASKYMRFSTANTERMRIDSSGNLGLGVSSPTNKFNVDFSITGEGSQEGGIKIQNSHGANNDIAPLYFGVHGGTRRTKAAIGLKRTGSYGIGDLIFAIDSNGDDANVTFANDEKMRIDSSGNLLVGTTSAASGFKLQVNGGAGNARYTNINTGGSTFDQFRFDGGLIGSITTNGVTTSYNTSSDQRLKENIVDAPSASDDIDAIQVRSFDWKADGSHQKYGMVAQELQGVAPEAVSGDADSEDMMGVDYSKLVPMMLKEIQSLRARVAQLEGEN